MRCMNRISLTCANCAGMGKTQNWKWMDDHTLQAEDVDCPNCNGRGYTDYAIFSIEEAEAILKHCGLSTESE